MKMTVKQKERVTKLQQILQRMGKLFAGRTRRPFHAESQKIKDEL